MKKKIIHGLLAAASMTSLSLFADVANKTFIADRGTLSSNALISRPGAKRDCKDGLGADITVAGFYRQSYNNTKLARYFGGGSTAADQNGTLGITASTTTAGNAGYGWFYDYTTAPAIAARGTVAFNPRRIEAGAQVQWNQCLNKFVKGLSFNVAAPFVYVSTEMRTKYVDAVANANTVASNATTGFGNNLSDILSGGGAGKTVPATQNVLTNQKLTTTKNTANGIADVKVQLGYKFVEEANYSFGGSLVANIPTGNKPAGVVAFEPVYGSRNFSAGAGLNGHFRLWSSEDKKSRLGMHVSGQYTYGFAADQVRTLGLTNTTTGVVSGAQYRLVAKNETSILAPLANVSTLAVTVEPKSRMEAIAGFCYRFNRLAVDISYNLFYNQAENVKLKGVWDELGYGLPVTSLAATPTFSVGNNAEVLGGAILAPGNTTNTYSLDLAAATTPAQLIHKVGGGVSYNFDGSLPICIGAGADAELSTDNNSINTWGVWAKLGFSF